MERLDLAALVRDVAELYEPVAEEAGSASPASRSSRACVRANRQLVGQAVANLIDNAIKYGGVQARVPRAVSAASRGRRERNGRGIEIAVADRGPGVAEATASAC